MWTFLLDPVFQGVAFALVLGALGLVAWDLFDDAGLPAPFPNFSRSRRATSREPPRRGRAFDEPSVEIWTDPQGETHGRVRRGPARGARLEDLTREDCEAQAAYARENDPPAAAALESYMRQKFGARRRYEAQIEGRMTRAQALLELGLNESATEADIHVAYRALMKRHHPDHGGSHAKAARLNQAKDCLSA